MTPLKSLLAVTAIIGATSALADEPSYHYLQSHYVRANLDADAVGKSFKPDGFGFAYSKLFSQNWFFDVSTETLEDNVMGAKVEHQSTLAALGFRTSLANGTDLVLRAGYDWQDIKIRADGHRWSDDDRTAFGSVGIRSRLNSAFEVGGSVTRYDGGNGWLKEVYGQYNLTNTVSLGLSHGRADDVDLTRLYVRVNF